MAVKDDCDVDAGAANDGCQRGHWGTLRTATKDDCDVDAGAANDGCYGNVGTAKDGCRRVRRESTNLLFSDEEEGGVQGEAAGMGTEKGQTMGFCIGDFEADGDGVAGLDEAEWNGDFLEVTIGASLVEGEGIGVRVDFVVIDGSVRDAQDIIELGLPVFVRGMNPSGTVKASLGEVNVPVRCGGVDVHPGDIVLGDCDGVVVVPQAAEDEVFAKAEAKFEKEEHLVEMLKAGKTTLEIYGFDNLIEKLKAI